MYINQKVMFEYVDELEETNQRIHKIEERIREIDEREKILVTLNNFLEKQIQEEEKQKNMRNLLLVYTKSIPPLINEDIAREIATYF